MLPSHAFAFPGKSVILEGLQPHLWPVQLSYVILDKWLRRVCATECLGIVHMTHWVCFIPWELRACLKSVFCVAPPHKSGEIILPYQPFTLNRFKRDSEVLLWWSMYRTEDCISFVFQTLLGKDGGRSQYKTEAIRS